MNIKLQFTFIVVIIALASIGCTGLLAQGFGDRNRPSGLGTYRISGRILKPDGTPASNIRVIASSEDPDVSTVTDQDGNYTLSGLKSGNYTVTVREKGYQTENERITISEGTISGQAFTASFYLRLPGQPKQSAPPANPFLTNVPKPAVSKFEKAMALLEKDDAKGAVPLFDEAIGLYPDFYLAYAEKGSAYLRLHDPDKAVEAFVKAITIKPDFLPAKYGYGNAMLEKKNYEVAAAAFNDVLMQKAEFPEAHQNLGIALYSIKNLDDAEKELKTAATAKGGEKLALAHLYLGLIYETKKQNAHAITEFEKYIELAPKAGNVEKVKGVIADLKKKT